jgi:molecular chaperone DnaJ
MAGTDLYDVLGVDRGATPDEIKRAYRTLARKLHPDANPDDPSAETRFKEVALAYEVLSDPEKRRRYDTFGMQGVSGSGSAGEDPFGFGGGGGLGDIFEAFFGGQSPFGGGRGPAGPPRGADLEVVADLSFEEAVFGCRHQVEVRTAVACETCSGSGAAPGSRASRCGECSGAGQVRRVRQSFLGQMVSTSVCPRCNGAGELIDEPCADCSGEGRRLEDRAYTVDIPAGVDTGSTLRLTGRGAAGPRGGPAGDLYVHVRAAAHDRFRRDGIDLRCDLPITFTQATLGAHLRFETLDGGEDLVIPRGTPTGREFHLKGRGVPHLERRIRGDLIVRVEVEVPGDLDAEQEELLRRFAELRGDDVAPADSGFFARIRSAFR